MTATTLILIMISLTRWVVKKNPFINIEPYCWGIVKIEFIGKIKEIFFSKKFFIPIIMIPATITKRTDIILRQ
ncbi:MAG: hypothetical protein WDK96_01855 [Candidatus Paceibacterota bacterium]|jgi:hypothetical protein